MSEPTVAHEIIDSIIDHLQSDKAALTACSLVSKTWTLRSTHHLFSHVSINKWNFKKIQTLPQPSSRIVGRVRMLLIYLLNHEQATSEHLCPRVQPFSSVTVLALFRVYFSTFDEFTQLLCCFPKLQVLSLNTLIWNQEPTTPLIVECGCPPMELHTLNVGWQIEGFPSGIPWLFEWFLAKGMPPLSTVRLRGFSDEDIPLINDALKNLRNSLRSLELELGVLRSLELELGVVDDDDNVGPIPHFDGINLSQHHHLQSLSILNGRPKSLHNLLKTLSQQSTLKDATISLLPWWHRPDLPYSRENLDHYLGNSATGHHSVVQLHVRVIPVRSDTGEMIERIKSRFRLCSARGNLHVVAETAVPQAGQWEGFFSSTWISPSLRETAQTGA